MFFVVRLFDQSSLTHLELRCLAFECSIIVVIIFDVDDIVDFDNFFNIHRISMDFLLFELWHFVIAI